MYSETFMEYLLKYQMNNHDSSLKKETKSNEKIKYKLKNEFKKNYATVPVKSE